MKNLSSGSMQALVSLMGAGVLFLLAGCGPSGAPPAPPATQQTASQTPATVVLGTSGTSVQSDGATSVTITATVLNSANAVIPNLPVTFSSTSGQLSVPSGITDNTGKTSFTFNAGPSGINRTDTISVTAGAITTQIPIQVTGTTMTVNPVSGYNVTDNGSVTATVTFTVLNAGGVPVTNTPVTLTPSGTGQFTVSPASGAVTDINGKLTVTITGSGAGAATLAAAAAGTTASTNFTVTTVTANFGISGASLTTGGVTTVLTAAATNNFTSTSMKTGDTLTITVTAPNPTTNVTFATTMGTWTGGTNTITVPVATGIATATLTTNAAGQATVQVIDANPLNTPASDSLSVSMTAITPASITLQASPSLVPKSSGTTVGSSTLIATVKDVNGLPVGGAPVVFNILNPTGGGESVSPVIAYTASVGTASLGLGQAMTTFTAGSLSSGATGIQVRASVLGTPGPCPGATCVATEANTNPATNVSPSGNDASIVIGGSAGSVAFGQATVVSENGNKTAYILPMSVMVADSNGNPAPVGTTVNLSLWPIAWSTSSKPCTEDRDGQVWDPNVLQWVTGNGGTFFNEDANENLILDAIEDGNRTLFASGIQMTGGKVDSLITPVNSTAGTLPGTVFTDASGVATFSLTYPKSSAIWTVVRIRGRTVVQGSDAVGEVIFRLAPSKPDSLPCILPPSPHIF